MKLIVETDNLSELKVFAAELLGNVVSVEMPVVAMETEPEKVQEEAPVKAEEPKAEEPKAEEPKAEEPKAEEPVKVTADEVKRLLVAANKKTSSKIATELVHKIGYEKFSEVPEEKLAELKAMAEEAIANAAD